MLYVQELVHEDFDRRIEFCELIEARGNDFVNNIIFYDEKFRISLDSSEFPILEHQKSTLDER